MLNNAKSKHKNRKMHEIDRKVQRNDRFVTNCPIKIANTIGRYKIMRFQLCSFYHQGTRNSPSVFRRGDFPCNLPGLGKNQLLVNQTKESKQQRFFLLILF